MRLKSLSIQNFRALENINIEFTGTADVIVGPNAVGKTTVLEAIRITRAILAPRVPNEAQQALISLGAISPHLPQQLNFAAIARDPKLPLVIDCKYELSASEANDLEALEPALTNAVVQSGLGSAFGDKLALVQFLSSAHGQAELAKAAELVKANLIPIKNSRICRLQVTFNPTTQNFSGADSLAQLVIAALEGRLPPHRTLFSYFPADRSMPAGDVNIQLGAPDVNAQLLSYNSQPQTKYHRLKTTIVNNYLLSADKPKTILEDFKRIFSNLMKDREILGLKLNDFGLVSVQIKDLTTNQVFDIDGMSSGEKGLVLTFLLIGRTLANGGIILIDEPELHLNPAVCRLLLPFLIDEYLQPQSLQAIICSHSPEILGVAFDRPDCGLHHLQSQTIVSPIFAEDKKEVFDALRRLGTSASDVLFSSGSIFVEGDNDIEILEAGFSQILSRFNVTQLEGRTNVEREIQTLQEAEVRGEVDTLKCFIFDLDNAPTRLHSSKLVRVNQWKRRTIENYLINDKVIYDLLRDDDISRQKIENRGEALRILRDIALTQLNDTVAKIIYSRFPFGELGPPPQRELIGKSLEESSAILFARIAAVQGQISSLRQSEWCADFAARCEAELAVQRAKWDSEWTVLCDGKRFFRDLHSRFGVRVSLIRLKVRIMERLERERADEWVVLESFLREALKP
jgi:predicted ATPase